jgi:hypothetical protein
MTTSRVLSIAGCLLGLNSTTGLHAAIPQSPGHYKDIIPSNLGLVHITVEVHRSTESQV